MIDRDKIKSLREARGMSLADAAIRAGWGRTGRTRWHDIESGRRSVLTNKTIEQIALALECSPRTIIGGKNAD